MIAYCISFQSGKANPSRDTMDVCANPESEASLGVLGKLKRGNTATFRSICDEQEIQS